MQKNYSKMKDMNISESALVSITYGITAFEALLDYNSNLATYNLPQKAIDKCKKQECKFAKTQYQR